MAQGEIFQLLQRGDDGQPSAADRILPLVYDELRKLAAAKLAREGANHTLQPTELVHEAWLRLGGDQQPPWRSRAEFFAAAAESMRRILIDDARRRGALRRGGGAVKVSASDTGFDVAAPENSGGELELLSEALENLAKVEPRKAALVKHWYFVGITVEEAAGILGISKRTAERDWAQARGWLIAEMDRLR